MFFVRKFRNPKKPVCPGGKILVKCSKMFQPCHFPTIDQFIKNKSMNLYPTTCWRRGSFFFAQAGYLRRGSSGHPIKNITQIQDIAIQTNFQTSDPNRDRKCRRSRDQRRGHMMFRDHFLAAHLLLLSRCTFLRASVLVQKENQTRIFRKLRVTHKLSIHFESKKKILM